MIIACRGDSTEFNVVPGNVYYMQLVSGTEYVGFAKDLQQVDTGGRCIKFSNLYALVPIMGPQGMALTLQTAFPAAKNNTCEEPEGLVPLTDVLVMDEAEDKLVDIYQRAIQEKRVRAAGLVSANSIPDPAGGSKIIR